MYDMFNEYVTGSSMSSTDKDKTLHIFIVGFDSQTVHLGGAAAGIPALNEHFLTMKGMYYVLYELSGGGGPTGHWRNDIAQTMAHEIGHTLGLFHAYQGDYIVTHMMGIRRKQTM